MSFSKMCPHSNVALQFQTATTKGSLVKVVEQNLHFLIVSIITYLFYFIGILSSSRKNHWTQHICVIATD